MKKILLLITIVILTAVDFGLAQNAPLSGASGQTAFINIPPELEQKCNTFFESLSKSEIKKAFDKILEGSPIKNKEEQINNLIEQTKQSIVLYGKLNDAEAVSSEIATPSLIRLRYLAVHNIYPMRWIFTFYKSPKSGWIIINIKLDDLSEYFFSDQ